MIHRLPALLLPVLLLSSCIKESGDSERRKLIIGDWVKAFDGQDANANEVLEEGEREAVGFTLHVAFKEDGTFLQHTGPGSAQTTGSWGLVDNDLQIVFGSDTNRIHTLTPTSFIIEGRYHTNLSWVGFRR